MNVGSFDDASSLCYRNNDIISSAVIIPSSSHLQLQASTIISSSSSRNNHQDGVVVDKRKVVSAVDIVNSAETSLAVSAYTAAADNVNAEATTECTVDTAANIVASAAGALMRPLGSGQTWSYCPAAVCGGGTSPTIDTANCPASSAYESAVAATTASSYYSAYSDRKPLKFWPTTYDLGATGSNGIGGPGGTVGSVQPPPPPETFAPPPQTWCNYPATRMTGGGHMDHAGAGGLTTQQMHPTYFSSAAVGAAPAVDDRMGRTHATAAAAAAAMLDGYAPTHHHHHHHDTFTLRNFQTNDHLSVAPYPTGMYTTTNYITTL